MGQEIGRGKRKKKDIEITAVSKEGKGASCGAADQRESQRRRPLSAADPRRVIGGKKRRRGGKKNGRIWCGTKTCMSEQPREEKKTILLRAQITQLIASGKEEKEDNPSLPFDLKEGGGLSGQVAR